MIGKDAEFCKPKDNLDLAKGLALEAKTLVIRDKAQFEGRFFVKIHRDSVIDNNIIAKQANIEPEYVISMSRDIKYLCAAHPGVQDWAHRIPNIGNTTNGGVFLSTPSSYMTNFIGPWPYGGVTQGGVVDSNQITIGGGNANLSFQVAIQNEVILGRGVGNVMGYSTGASFPAVNFNGGPAIINPPNPPTCCTNPMDYPYLVSSFSETCDGCGWVYPGSLTLVKEPPQIPATMNQICWIADPDVGAPEWSDGTDDSYLGPIPQFTDYYTTAHLTQNVYTTPSTQGNPTTANWGSLPGPVWSGSGANWTGQMFDSHHPWPYGPGSNQGPFGSRKGGWEAVWSASWPLGTPPPTYEDIGSHPTRGAIYGKRENGWPSFTPSYWDPQIGYDDDGTQGNKWGQPSGLNADFVWKYDFGQQYGLNQFNDPNATSRGLDGADCAIKPYY